MDGLGLFFAYFIYPFLQNGVFVLHENLHLSFFLGIYGGVFAVDLWQSFDLAARIKAFVNESEEKWSVDYERFKLELRDRVQSGIKNRTRFLLPFRGELGTTFRDRLRQHRLKIPRPLKPLREALKRNNDKS